MRTKSRTGLDFLVPVAVAGLFAALSLVPAFRGADSRVYDLLLHVKPAIAERQDIRLIDIDDTAIEKVGTFPWSRDIMADGLILMREMGARTVMFDIEYVDPSPRGVNADLLEKALPETLALEFTNASENAAELVRSVRSGRIRGAAVDEYLAQLAASNELSRRRVEEKIRQIARDNDVYLGQAARFFGSAFLTINMLADPENVMSDELRAYALEHIALDGATVKSPIRRPARPVPFRVPDVRPAILPIISGARGAGFPNVVVDSDGVRRRIDLVTEYEGRIFAQIGFRPLLDWLGDPGVVVESERITLKEAVHPDGKKRDIVIPLASDGRMLINWPRKTFIESFAPHMTWWSLVQNKRLEENLLHNLRAMADAGYLGYFPFPLLDAWQFAESIRDEVLAGGDLAPHRRVRQGPGPVLRRGHGAAQRRHRESHQRRDRGGPRPEGDRKGGRAGLPGPARRHQKVLRRHAGDPGDAPGLPAGPARGSRRRVLHRRMDRHVDHRYRRQPLRRGIHERGHPCGDREHDPAGALSRRPAVVGGRGRGPRARAGWSRWPAAASPRSFPSSSAWPFSSWWRAPAWSPLC